MTESEILDAEMVEGFNDILEHYYLGDYEQSLLVFMAEKSGVISSTRAMNIRRDFEIEHIF